jgi:hypothetical protein
VSCPLLPFRSAPLAIPPGRALQAVGRMRSPALCGDFHRFSIILISRNLFKLLKFVETCRNVQKL